MEFCETCDALLILKRDKENKPYLHCRDCNEDFPLKKKQKKDYIVTEEVPHDERDRIEVTDREAENAISAEMREELMESYRESIESFQY